MPPSQQGFHIPLDQEDSVRTRHSGSGNIVDVFVGVGNRVLGFYLEGFPVLSDSGASEC